MISGCLVPGYEGATLIQEVAKRKVSLQTVCLHILGSDSECDRSNQSSSFSEATTAMLLASLVPLEVKIGKKKATKALHIYLLENSGKRRQFYFFTSPLLLLIYNSSQGVFEWFFFFHLTFHSFSKRQVQGIKKWWVKDGSNMISAWEEM